MQINQKEFLKKNIFYNTLSAKFAGAVHQRNMEQHDTHLIFLVVLSVTTNDNISIMVVRKHCKISLELRCWHCNGYVAVGILS